MGKKRAKEDSERSEVPADPARLAAPAEPARLEAGDLERAAKEAEASSSAELHARKDAEKAVKKAERKVRRPHRKAVVILVAVLAVLAAGLGAFYWFGGPLLLDPLSDEAVAESLTDDSTLLAGFADGTYAGSSPYTVSEVRLISDGQDLHAQTKDYRASAKVANDSFSSQVTFDVRCFRDESGVWTHEVENVSATTKATAGVTDDPECDLSGASIVFDAAAQTSTAVNVFTEQQWFLTRVGTQTRHYAFDGTSWRFTGEEQDAITHFTIEGTYSAKDTSGKAICSIVISDVDNDASSCMLHWALAGSDTGATSSTATSTLGASSSSSGSAKALVFWEQGRDGTYALSDGNTYWFETVDSNAVAVKGYFVPDDQGSGQIYIYRFRLGVSTENAFSGLIDHVR